MNRNLEPGQFYGDVLGKRQDSGLILSELRHTGARKLPNHSHELAYFCLLLGGSYSERFGTKLVNYKPLTVMFHPPGTTHLDEIGLNGGRFFSIELKQEWIDRLLECVGVLDVETKLHEGELAWLALRLYREHKEFDSCSLLTIEGLVMEMLATVGRMREPRERYAPRWLSRATDLLRAEFQRNLKVKEIAIQVGVHPFHLSKVFRQFHRQSIGEYLHKLRVEFACRQLALPETELASVALAAGFGDQSHFSRVFKSVTGITPGVFKKIATEHQ